jgi:hypothetical protein
MISVYQHSISKRDEFSQKFHVPYDMKEELIVITFYDCHYWGEKMSIWINIEEHFHQYEIEESNPSVSEKCALIFQSI